MLKHCVGTLRVLASEMGQGLNIKIIGIIGSRGGICRDNRQKYWIELGHRCCSADYGVFSTDCDVPKLSMISILSLKVITLKRLNVSSLRACLRIDVFTLSSFSAG